MISRQFNSETPLVSFPKPPKAPKVKSGRAYKPAKIDLPPTPEEKALILAKARNLDAKTRKLNNGLS